MDTVTRNLASIITSADAGDCSHGQLIGDDYPMRVFDYWSWPDPTHARHLVHEMFTGRATEVAALKSLILARYPLVSITGSSGIGKMSVVVMAAARLNRAGRVSFYVTTYHMADRGSLDAQDSRIGAECDRENWGWVIREATRAKATVLVVSASGTTSANLQPLLERVRRESDTVGQVIILSEDPLPNDLPSTAMKLGRMTTSEIGDMLVAHARVEGWSDAAAAYGAEIAARSDGNPGRAVKAAGYVLKGYPVPAASELARDGFFAWRYAQGAHDAMLGISTVNSDLCALIASQPDMMYGLTPRQFEELIADLYSRHGYRVEMTAPSGDGGVDLYVVKKGLAGNMLTVVECKRYTPPNKVKVDAVRALWGTVDDKKASSGALITSSFFTRGARDFESDHAYRLDLVDFARLASLLGESYLPERRADQAWGCSRSGSPTQ